MIKRFSKLIYTFCLVALAVSLPIYLLSNIQFDRITESSYKAKCLSNSEYVVLEGDNEPLVLHESFWNSENQEELKRQLNFYCKYYDKVQPYITAYLSSKTIEEQMNVNSSFFNFRESVDSNISSYPPLYNLEVVDEKFQPYQLYGPIINWFGFALLAFLILQIVKISYLYVVFGEIVWHPFRSNKV